eukprot:7384140-Prymnesium_polylepis.2
MIVAPVVSRSRASSRAGPCFPAGQTVPGKAPTPPLGARIPLEQQQAGWAAASGSAPWVEVRSERPGRGRVRPHPCGRRLRCVSCSRAAKTAAPPGGPGWSCRAAESANQQDRCRRSTRCL